MPIFEYRCLSCGKKFEILCGVGKSGQGDIKCPECGKSDLKKLISSPYVAGTESSSSCLSCSTNTCSSCSSCK